MAAILSRPQYVIIYLIIWKRFLHYSPIAGTTSYRWITLAKGQQYWVCCFFAATVAKLFNKQSMWRWFDTPWRPCEVTVPMHWTVSVIKFVVDVLVPNRRQMLYLTKNYIQQRSNLLFFLLPAGSCSHTVIILGMGSALDTCLWHPRPYFIQHTVIMNHIQRTMAGTINPIPQYLWDVILPALHTYPSQIWHTNFHGTYCNNEIHTPLQSCDN